MKNQAIKKIGMISLLALIVISMAGVSCTLDMDGAKKSPGDVSRPTFARTPFPPKTTVGDFTFIRRSSVTEEWEAVFNDPDNDAVIIGDMQTYNGHDSSQVRFKIKNGDVFAKIEEESRNATHPKSEEIVAIMCEPGIIYTDYGDANFIGMAFNKEVTQPDSDTWFDAVVYKPTWDAEMNYPVVFASVKTWNGRDPCHVRIRDVKGTRDVNGYELCRFQYKIEEWASFAPGDHPKTETVSFLVMGEDMYDMGMDNGKTAYDWGLEVSRVERDGNEDFGLNPKYFYTDFVGGPPAMITQVQTCNDSDPVVTRKKDINTRYTYFNVCLQEESGSDYGHGEEVIGYLALGPVEAGGKSDVVDDNGRLRVYNGKLCNKNYSPVQLKGMSLFWINWDEGKDFANSDVIRWLVDDWNVDVIRIPLGVDPHNQYGERIDESGYIFNKDELREIVYECVETCIKKGVYVIVDWHVHDALPHIDEAKDFFINLCSYFGNAENIIYEIWNEPSIEDNDFKDRGDDYYCQDDDITVPWNTIYNWEDDIKPYCEELVDYIRGFTNNVIICGNPDFSKHPDVAKNSPINEDNIMYAFHFYAGTDKVESTGSPYWYLLDALQNNVPVFATEWGTTYNDGGQPADTIYCGQGTTVFQNDTMEWIDYLNDNTISWCNWSVTDKNEGSAILKNTAGTRGGWLDSQLSTSGNYVKYWVIPRL